MAADKHERGNNHNPAADWLELAVTDTGIGISVEDQQKVFASFNQ